MFHSLSDTVHQIFASVISNYSSVLFPDVHRYDIHHTSRTHHAECSAHMLKQLSCLADSKMVQLMFSAFLSVKQPQSVVDNLPSLGSVPSGFIHLCGLYVSLQANWKVQQMSLLNVLTYSSPLLRILWNYLSHSRELAEFARTGVAGNTLCTSSFTLPRNSNRSELVAPFVCQMLQSFTLCPR